MTELQRVRRLFAEANPIPDANSFAQDAVGGTTYLATLEERSSEMIRVDMSPTEKEPTRGRLGLVLGASAAVILIGGLIALSGGAADDPSPAAMSQPEAITLEMIPAQQFLRWRSPNSMEDTIHPDALLTIDRLAYDSEIPERFDIVIYAPAGGGGVLTPPELVGRVIGLPGETIEIRDGSVHANDRILDEPYLKNPDIPQAPLGPIALGPDELLVIGDNRQASYETQIRGVIDLTMLRGEVVGAANP